MKRTIRRIEFSLETTSSVRVTKLSETHEALVVTDDERSSQQNAGELPQHPDMCEVKDEDI